MKLAQAVLERERPNVEVPEDKTINLTDPDDSEWVVEGVDGDEYDEDEEAGIFKRLTKDKITIIVGAAAVLLLLAVFLGTLFVRKQALREADLKEWVAQYLYEAVSGDGTGLLTNEQIDKISRDVSLSLVPMLGEAFDLDNLTDEQRDKFISQIQEELGKNEYALNAKEVATISEGVVEKYIKDHYGELTANGGTLSDAELQALKNEISKLKQTDSQLQTSISTVSAQRGATGPAGATGARGATGATGARGEKGAKGDKGEKGADGLSAYEIAVKNGFKGSESQWTGDLQGQNGTDGKNGKSAYELAVESGYKGTIDEWAQSLEGKSAYQLAVDNGFTGTLEEWSQSLEGKSAYDVAVKNGYAGSEADWLSSLKGSSGTSSFVVYSKYPNGIDEDGNPSFSFAPDITTGYTGVANVVATTAPTEASAYTWTQFSQHTIEYQVIDDVPTVIIH